jgi:NADPH:quinone reductase-like Zn-dependent oxidoreductase
VRYIAGLTNTNDHFSHYVEMLAPQGHLALIDDLKESIDIRLLKPKSLSLHWESMFTRSIYRTPDMIAQHELLNAVSTLVDGGQLRSTLAEVLGPIDAEHLRRAHAMLESGRTIGKLVLAGFDR